MQDESAHSDIVWELHMVLMAKLFMSNEFTMDKTGIGQEEYALPATFKLVVENIKDLEVK